MFENRQMATPPQALLDAAARHTAEFDKKPKWVLSIELNTLVQVLNSTAPLFKKTDVELAWAMSYYIEQRDEGQSLYQNSRLGLQNIWLKATAHNLFV